ncbi:MAG TPA: Gfo/Idh/MocA family oxidoreductase [Chloroflexota bacterium]|nr:Gfo/Idh/MocA family oxidoreductase [Chloroflexota bacterium]
MVDFNVAIVGCGAVADWHAQRGYANLRELVRLAVVCDTRSDRAEALAQATGARAVTDLDAVLADPAIHGVDLCVPHHLHAPLALRALAAGKHVLVEKPIATSVEDAEKMVALAEERGLALSVSEQYPFSPPFVKARDLIKEGAIGKLVTIRTHRVGYLDGIWMRDGWRQNADIAGGGMLLDQGCHYTSIARLLAGDIASVAAFTANTRSDWVGDDTATLILRFASGIIGEALYCWGTRTSHVGAECYVYGERGHLRVNSGRPGLVLYRQDLANGEQVLLDQWDERDLFDRIIEDWVRSALGQREPTMPGREGLADLKVVMAAYRSAKSGKVEAV